MLKAIKRFFSPIKPCIGEEWEAVRNEYVNPFTWVPKTCKVMDLQGDWIKFMIHDKNLMGEPRIQIASCKIWLFITQWAKCEK